MRWAQIIAHYTVFALLIVWWLEGDPNWIPTWWPNAGTWAALLPIIPTIKAMNEPNAVRRSLLIARWLSYFLCWFMVYPIISWCGDALDWLPAFNLLPPFFLIWLLLPWTQGGQLLFATLSPYLLSESRALQDSFVKRTESVNTGGPFRALLTLVLGTQRMDTIVAISRTNPLHLGAAVAILLALPITIFLPGTFITHNQYLHDFRHHVLMGRIGFLYTWALFALHLAADVFLPCFFSLRALAELPTPLPASAHGSPAEHWLLYWAIFCVWSLTIDHAREHFLFWVPMFEQCKIVAVLWLHVPLTRGAFRLFDLIRPFIIAPIGVRGSRSGSMSLSGNGVANGNGRRGSPTNGGSVGGPGAHAYDADYDAQHATDEYDIHRINERRAQS